MNKQKTVLKATDFEDYLAKELRDPEFKRLYDEAGRQLEIAYRINHLRRRQKISQADLAKKVGTTQSNIARIESGNENVTIQTLDKIANALGAELRVVFR